MNQLVPRILFLVVGLSACSGAEQPSGTAEDVNAGNAPPAADGSTMTSNGEDGAGGGEMGAAAGNGSPGTEMPGETNGETNGEDTTPSAPGTDDDTSPRTPQAEASSPGAAPQDPAPGNASDPATAIAPGPSPLATDDVSSIPPGSGPLGVETTCDGLDDDKNGVIDDVDAAGDGVCDCLQIATLGLHGEWGGGDFTSNWLPSRIEQSIQHLGDSALTADALASVDVLIIRDISINHNPGLSYTSAEADLLWNWVREGGGLMTLIGYSDPGEVTNVNGLLSPFGLSYGQDQIIPGQGSAAPITDFYEHPITDGLTQVAADNGYPTLGQGTTIASGDGFDFGKAVTIGDGHVLVWGDEWVSYEQEWADSSVYQVDMFWTNALRWLTRRTACQVPAP